MKSHGKKSPAGNFEWYGLLNHSGQLGNAFHEPLPIQNIKLSFKPEKKISSIKKLTDGKKLSFQNQKDGRVEVVVPELKAFDIILVEY